MSWLQAFFHRTERERQLDTELRFHLEQQIKDNIAAGLSPEQARREALLEFGGVDQIKESCRDVASGHRLETLLRGLRFGVRSLCKSPGFAIVSVLMLALGIGMSTSAFSTANCVLLRPLPFPDGDRIMRIHGTSPLSQMLRHSPANYLYIRSAASSFSEIAAYYVDVQNIAEIGQAPEAQPGLIVSANFLTTLGVRPSLGRDFAPDEDQPGKGDVVLLTNAYWRHRFSGDPKVVGRILRIGGANVTVIGILPPIFDNTENWAPEVFIRPLTIWPNFATLRESKWLSMMGRLKPGVSRRTAQAEMSALANRIDHDNPAENGLDGLRVTAQASSATDSSSRKWYWLTTGLAALVLVIACANLASVQLARAFGRSQEFAVRAALGAGQFNLMAPLLAESVLLNFAGGIMGVWVAHWANRLLSRYFWDGYPIPLDGRVLLFAFAASVATGVAFGLAPAWLASRVSTGNALKELSRESTAGRAHQGFKLSLVAGQVALALVLVSAAWSFGAAIKQSLKRDLGWHPTGLFSGWIGNLNNYRSDAKRNALIHELRAKLGQIPGVTQVMISSEELLYGYAREDTIIVEGFGPNLPGREQWAQSSAVDPDFFSVLKIPLKAGRRFQDNLKADGPKVVIINETMARQYWPGQTAIGKRVRFAGQSDWNEVVGIVGDIHASADFGSPASHLQIYRALAQTPGTGYNFLLKSTLPAESLIVPVRKIIGEIDPDITVQELGGVEETLHRMVADANDEKIATLGSFASIGLLIALIGLYGVMTQLTVQRSREIGIRIALGADSAAIVRLILSQGAKVIFCGLSLGLLGASGIHEFYRQTMPELQLPGSGLQLVIATLLCLSGLGACYLPARRAGRINPVMALRSE
jgi:predicted permease